MYRIVNKYSILFKRRHVVADHLFGCRRNLLLISVNIGFTSSGIEEKYSSTVLNLIPCSIFCKFMEMKWFILTVQT